MKYSHAIDISYTINQHDLILHCMVQCHNLSNYFVSTLRYCHVLSNVSSGLSSFIPACLGVINDSTNKDTSFN